MQLLIVLIVIVAAAVPNVIQLVRSERQLRAVTRAAAVFFEADGRDHLTGLADRRGLYQARYRLASDGTPPGVLFLDLDAFKAVNDTYGHDVGDDLQRAIAARLHAVIAAAGGVAGRLGGDEFVVLLPGAVTGAQLTGTAERIHSALTEPIAVNGLTVPLTVTCHIGAAAPDEDPYPGRPFRAADIALYHARHHRTPTAVYHPRMTVLAAPDRRGPRLRDQPPSSAAALFDAARWNQILTARSADDDPPAEAGTAFHDLAERVNPHHQSFGDDVGSLLGSCVEQRIVTLAPAIDMVMIEPTSIGGYRDGGFLVLVRLAVGITLASGRMDPGLYIDDGVLAHQVVADITTTVASLYDTYRLIDPISGSVRS